MQERNHPTAYMPKSDMLAMFRRIGEICRQRNAYFEVAIYGGSALMLQFDYRQSTVDIDYVPIFGASERIEEIANQAARDLGLQQDILRDDVSIFISDYAKYKPYGEFPKGHGNFRVFLATPEYIFSMKMLSMRNVMETQDLRDAWELADVCGISTIEAAENLLSKFYPGKVLPIRNRLILQDVFEAKANGQAYSPAMGW